MADLSPASSILVGVDQSISRISLCKNIVKKYHIDGSTSASQSTLVSAEAKEHSNAESKIPSRVTIRMYCADGTTFGTNESNSTVNRGLVFESNAAMEEFQSRGKRNRVNKTVKAQKRILMESQRRGEHTNIDAKTGGNNLNGKGTETVLQSICDLRHDEASGCAHAVPPFDCVLVDAECSTDGAIRRIEKKFSSQSPIWNNKNMDELIDLQKHLIHSGFWLPTAQKGGGGV